MAAEGAALPLPPLQPSELLALPLLAAGVEAQQGASSGWITSRCVVASSTGLLQVPPRAATRPRQQAALHCASTWELRVVATRICCRPAKVVNREMNVNVRL